MPSFTSTARAASGLAVALLVKAFAALRKSREKVGLRGSSSGRGRLTFPLDDAVASFGMSPPFGGVVFSVVQFADGAQGLACRGGGSV